MYASVRVQGKFLEFAGVKQVFYLLKLLNLAEGEGLLSG